jgi:hypothetical protein
MSDDTPGINLKGYFQEKKGKGATPVSKNPEHKFGPPPKVECNAAQRKGQSKSGKAAKKSKQEDSSSSDEQ